MQIIKLSDQQIKRQLLLADGQKVLTAYLQSGETLTENYWANLCIDVEYGISRL